MSNEESKKFGAQGGKKRAANMTKTERTVQAQRAAVARWSPELPVAEFVGELRFGDIVISCAVLPDGTRLLTQAELLVALGRHRKANVRNVEGEENVPPVLQGERLKPFISKELLKKSQPIRFRTKAIVSASGYNAEILPDLCRVYLAAKEAGALTKNQEHIAVQAAILLGGLATIGIIELVDRATGFKDISDQRALAEQFLRIYVQKEVRAWVSTFPRSFFEQICRLKAIAPPGDNMRLPQYMGHIVNDLVWSRIAPGVLADLKTVNPVVGPKGRRRAKHHQFATPAVGNPKLLNLVGRLEGIAYRFGDGEYDEYKAFVDRTIPNYGSLPLWSGAEIPKILAEANAAVAAVPPQTVLTLTAGDESAA